MGRLTSRWPGTPQSLDRALVIACAAIWLLVVGMGVAAAVALADLGRGHSAGESDSGTSWLLYVVIAVSALVIVLAVPLLLRARNAATSVTQDPAATPPPRAAALPADHESPGYVEPNRAKATPKVPGDVLDRIWLRCGAGVIAATGAAMLQAGQLAFNGQHDVRMQVVRDSITGAGLHAFNNDFRVVFVEQDNAGNVFFQLAHVHECRVKHDVLSHLANQEDVPGVVLERIHQTFFVGDQFGARRNT